MQLNSKKYDAFCLHIFDYVCLRPGAYLRGAALGHVPLLTLLFSKKVQN